MSGPHCPCEDHLQAALSDGCRCTDHVHQREDIAAPDRAGLREALTDLQGELSGTERRTYDDHSWANHVAIQVQKVMDAVTASPEPTGLDAAWAEAEAAADKFREGSTRWTVRPASPIELRRYDADHYGAKGEGKHAMGETPEAALRALAARLGETRP